MNECNGQRWALTCSMWGPKETWSNGVQGPDGKRDVYRPALARRLKERSCLKTASSDRLLRLVALIHTPMCVPYVELA